ncbi:MAG: HPr family phosphocarrier protein [Anaeromicrobium sp.]|jgi:phosphocarrier protein|uniref:HPr family phosphocarrier protein n=1 Tax=Anaeromicrobium sp. TaxID=1929132 RepID=UPI0025D72940|nr:HPr family phosphocarrier protein [Anaeromicrobium sp.]MCT4594368.1 HPr family phosphocarrier protein [Anaeromicrobium sp.]
MVVKSFRVIDPAGIHARPASILSQKVMSYKGDVKIKFAEKEGNLKSIMSIMALGIKQNSEFSIAVDGEGSEEMLLSLESTLVENNIVK